MAMMAAWPWLDRQLAKLAEWGQGIVADTTHGVITGLDTAALMGLVIAALLVMIDGPRWIRWAFIAYCAHIVLSCL